MSATWRRLPAPMLAKILLAAVLALAALRIDGTPRAAAQTPATASLTGQLLVASPSMSDPNFARTVILIIQHDRNGAFGIAVNRPVGERPLAALRDTPGEKDIAATGTIRIFAGGPVQPEIGFVVHSSDYHGPTTLDVGAGIAMTSSPDILRDIGTDKGPQKSLIAFGYAGWAPGQLEAELARRDWVVAPGDARLVFDEDREKLWDAAFARRMLDL
jgi:putative transcriptional regulator